MKLIATSLLLLALSARQSPVQLTPIPPKPTCILLFETGSCADLWRNYTEALAKRRQEEMHLYVNRQEELASQAATLQQIATSTNSSPTYRLKPPNCRSRCRKCGGCVGKASRKQSGLE